MQLTLSADHYAYVAPAMGARFGARVATSGRDIEVRQQHRRQTSCVMDVAKGAGGLLDACVLQKASVNSRMKNDLACPTALMELTRPASS